jgi:hypothetical protein
MSDKGHPHENTPVEMNDDTRQILITQSGVAGKPQIRPVLYWQAREAMASIGSSINS